MKNLLRHIALCLVLLLLLPFSVEVSAANAVQQFTTPKGLSGLLITDRSLPMATLRLTVAYAGAVSDPADKQGRAHFAAQMLKEGAGTYTARAFREALEDRAIQLSVSASTDTLTIHLTCLTEHLPEAIRLMGLMLTQPTFEVKATQRMRQKLLSNLKQYQEDPGWHASRQWDKQAYGDHPYGYSAIGTEASLKAVQAADLKQWHHEVVTADQLTIAAVGDVDSTRLSLLLDSALRELPAKRRVLLPEAAKAIPAGTKPMVIDRDIPQTIALFGVPALPRSHPDFYAAYVMNYILGGDGLTGRLSEEIRQQRGLAYYASSHLSLMLLSSTLLGGFATRNDAAYEAVEVMQAVLKNAAENGFTAEEVANAKEYIIGSFPLELDNQDDRVAYLTSMQLNQLGEDYLQKRNGYFAAVTLDDVNRVAKQLLAPMPLTVLVGKPEKGVE